MSYRAVNGYNGDVITSPPPTGQPVSRSSSFNIRSSQYIAHQQKDWIEIQKNTFTNWCNEQLRNSGIVITDLETAFSDGITLVHLVEAVSMKKVPRWNKNPKLYAQILENTTAALKVLENDGIKLVNIGNEDIVNGNIKLILGLIWRLILHYQISSSGSTSGKQLLLLWLRNALPDLTIKNVTTDWNNGIALSALVNFCQPGLMSNYKSLNPEEKLRNVTLAMKTAEEKLRIPQILSPEAFISPYVDELSMMTYLSFFTQPGSPGERRTLEIINEAAPKVHARNFNTDWNSGQALGTFLETQCPGIITDYDDFDRMTAVQRADKGLKAAEEKLGVKKVLTGKEMTSPDVDELSVMAYMLQFRNCEKMMSHAQAFTAEGPGLRRAIRGRISEFQVFGRRDLGLDNVKVEMEGPTGRDVPVTVRQTLDGLKCQYTAHDTGPHKVSITHVGKNIPLSPFRVESVEDVSETMVSGQGLKNAIVMKPAEFIIKMSSPTSDPVTAVAEAPNGRTVPIEVIKQYDGSYRARFIAREVGEHKISVMVGSTTLPGCPFVSKVGDPTKVLLTPQDGGAAPQMGKPVTFEVDTTQAGLGELAIKCKGPKGGIPVDVRAITRGKYQVSYTPTIPGEYLTQCTFNSEEVPSSPKSTLIGDPNQIVAHGEGLYQVATQSQGEFYISFRGASNEGLEVYGEGPRGRFPVNVVENPRERDSYSVRYTPQGIGQHKIHVLYQGQPVRGSPFLVKVADPSKVRLTRTFSQSKGYVVRREVDIPVDVPREAGEGQLEASVMGPDLETIPSSVTQESDGYHHIRFMPRRVGNHKVMVKYGAKEVPESPYQIRVGDPSSVKVKESIHTRTGFKTMSEIDIPIDVPDDVGEITHAVKGPNLEHVQSTINKERDGLYHIRFTPNRAGRYTVDVLCAGHHIENSPMVMNVQEPGPVNVKLKEFENQERLRYRVRQPLDVPMEIPEEVKEVSAEVTGPQREHVLSTFSRESDGYHHLRFIPYNKGTYNVNVKCKGRLVDGSPFKINVEDPSSTLVRLRQSEVEETQYMVRRELDIAMDIPEDHWEVTSVVNGPDDEIMPSSIVKSADGYYHVKFVPYRPGNYKVHVRCDGEAVENSPFLIKVGEPEPVQVAHVRSEELYSERFIRDEVDLTVESSTEMDERLFRANVLDPDGRDLACNMVRDGNGRHHVKFMPHRPGQYKVFVRYNNELVEGAPFVVNVVDDNRVHVKIDEHTERYEAYQEVDLKVNAPVNSRLEQLDASVYDAYGEAVPCVVARGRDNTQYFVRFVPKTVGEHKMYMNYDGQATQGSPYVINILEGSMSAEQQARRVVASGSGVKKGLVNERSQFTVDASEVNGEGELTGKMVSINGSTDVDIQKRSNHMYNCYYTAESAGAYRMHMYWNGYDIRNSPFKVDVHDSLSTSKSHCKVQGEALSEHGAYVNQWMKFWVDTNGQGEGPLYVRCSGPTKDCDVKIYDNQDGTYDLQIYPTEVGTHEMHVSWGRRIVYGSPFLIRVGQEPDPSQVYAYGPGLENGVLESFQGNFLVETKGAGPGTLKIRIHGPKGAFKVEMYRDSTKERRIGVRYNPNEPGRYTVNIKWADQHIPGSPYEVHVVETMDEYEALSELNDNVVARPREQSF